MPTNVYEILVSEYPSLMDTLNTNDDVSSWLMSMYSTLLYHAIEDSRNPENLRLTVGIQEKENQFVLVVKPYYTSEGGRSVDIGTKLPRQRNLNLVKFLQVNPNVKRLALDVVYELEKWVSSADYMKSQGFQNVKTFNPMRWRDGTYTVELLMKFSFDEMVAAKMKWDMDDPVPEEATFAAGTETAPEPLPEIEWKK